MINRYSPQSETPYTETETLLAVMEEDDARAHQLLKDMTTTELNDFLRKVEILQVKVKNEQVIRRFNRRA